MKSYRKHIMRILKANNYSIGLFEHLAFLPHISVRLGVPYTKQARLMTEKGFAPGTKLTFNTWIILRDIKKDGKYLVKEIALKVRRISGLDDRKVLPNCGYNVLYRGEPK